MQRPVFLLAVAIGAIGLSGARAPAAELVCDADPHFRFQLAGVVGDRIAANSSGWLTRAPAANPGLLAMFELRDRDPVPSLMPWAGEFVGKYLISAIQAIRLDRDPRLFATVKSVIQEVMAQQAEDGYLGPFRQPERLLGQWDLWGHYHVMLALLMWHDQTGDTAALQACRQAADLVCQTYLGTDRRPRDAGSTEMNLAIIHALGHLYRVTLEDRYLQMMRVIEEDWEKEGDYLRTGLAGVEFYRTPKPRWESLPDLQGLVELYRITGDERYRTAFLHHWDSIRRLDRRNTGGFSSGEQATGTPYEPTAIETCCTIAWMAMTVDALRLTGDPTVADELELSTYNGMLGAQHPSGSWWTYNTPMNGVREASHHTIVFQARAGTPDLNCCSVNAPRGLGMLSEWAVMRLGEGLAVNYYGPMPEARVTLADGTPVTLRQDTRYPLDGTVKIQLQLQQPREFPLQLRIPRWSDKSSVQIIAAAATAEPRDSDVEDVPDQAAPGGSGTVAGATRTERDAGARPGSYVTLHRRWNSGDVVELQLDMTLRHEPGGGEMTGRMSVYRGPLLLAYDVLLTENGPPEPASITPRELPRARVAIPAPAPDLARIGRFAPWLVVDVPRADGTTLRLCDFASAGARGSHYVSWLPAREIAPPPPSPDYPEQGARVPPGRLLFRARDVATAPRDDQVRLQIAARHDMQEPLVDVVVSPFRTIVVPEEQSHALAPHTTYYWRLLAVNPWGTTASPALPRELTIDPTLPPLTDDLLTEYGENAEGVVVQARLQGHPDPQYGTLLSATGWHAATGSGGEPDQAVELNGTDGMLVYSLRAFPASDYTVALWCCPSRVAGPLGQIFSAWCRGMDDPLRISVQDGKLSARIEAGSLYATSGLPVEPDTWYHLCVVKQSSQLTLYVNGQPLETIRVPAVLPSAARDFALGGNPHFTGISEHLACRVTDLQLLARPLASDEVATLYANQAR